ncbi:MAG: hypothetical protein M3308_07580 [Actinomycetota bacterium]|nr:hypothetical protein [Actinomycetota bacterium]
MGTLLACTSVVANAVVSGDGSLNSQTAALPEPFLIQDSAPDPNWVGALVATTAFASTHRLTDSGRIVPAGMTGQDDDSLDRRTDGAVTPATVISTEPVKDRVSVPPGSPPASDPAPGVAGDEPDSPRAPALEPVTELLAPPPADAATPAPGASEANETAEASEPALSMLSPPLFV